MAIGGLLARPNEIPQSHGQQHDMSINIRINIHAEHFMKHRPTLRLALKTNRGDCIVELKKQSSANVA